MKQKYVNIQIADQDNIGIIELPKDDWDKEDIIKPLIEALESHFDADVKIISEFEIYSSTPITIEVKVSIDELGVDSVNTEVVCLNETWLYKK